ncbi:MAG: hypothetical protein RL292_118 [Candidatus Parcubacteria bacterium]|jgi:hypothetical protein
MSNQDDLPTLTMPSGHEFVSFSVDHGAIYATTRSALGAYTLWRWSDLEQRKEWYAQAQVK